MDCGEVSFRLDIRSPSVSSRRTVKEPHTESLETDSGADKTQLLWTLLASQADKGASRGIVAEDGAGLEANPLRSILLSNVPNLHAVFFCFFLACTIMSL